MNCLKQINLPEFELLHSGKVRDSYRATPNTRFIVVTDRLSAFDFILDTPIPNKGAVLNGISDWWFAQTADIIPNHVIQLIDPNVMWVREALPIRVEMVVRGYLTGSMWRGYAEGQREFSGAIAPENMHKNQAFAKALVTPTTKEKSDRPINPTQIVSESWATAQQYDLMQQTALQLFERGTQILQKKGLILVDTKYEFGMINDQLILIDEIHTPDSSRFWSVADYAQNPAQATQIDKEYIRQWMLANLVNGEYPHQLPPHIVAEAEKRYLQIYETLTDKTLSIDSTVDIESRIKANMHKAITAK
jgi:phosphoribosylaminoimidazole-succinocarboxamide synthase